MSRRISLGRNTVAWVYTNRKFTSVYLTASQQHDAEILKEFVDEVGIPEMLQADQGPEMVGYNTDFKKEIRRIQTRMTITEPSWKYKN
jgi:hypothetical protein